MYVFVNHFSVLHVFLTVGYDLKTLKATSPVGISEDLGVAVRRRWLPQKFPLS